MSAADHLSAHQLSVHRNNADSYATTYQVVRGHEPAIPGSLTHGTGRGDVVGEMHIERHEGYSSTKYPTIGTASLGRKYAGMIDKTEFIDLDAHNRGFSEVAQSWEGRHEQTSPPNGSDQGRLFVHESSPSSHVLGGLFVDRSARHLVGPLIGLAQNTARASTGSDLETPSSLSQFSSRLVSKMKGRGMVPAAADDEMSNDYDFSDSRVKHDERIYGEPVSSQEWNAGRSTMRSMLRRPQPPKPQGMQGSLF